jgi:hypothetical protein
MIAPVFHLSARVCLIPLKIAEITINNVVLVIPSRIIGIPLIVNASSVALNGFGIDPKLVASMKGHAKRSITPSLKKTFLNYIKSKFGG